MDSVNGVEGHLLIGRQRYVPVRRLNVNQVMTNARLLLCVRFGRADVHAPVDLPAVGADDLAAKAFCKIEAESGLADRRWPQDHDQRRPLYLWRMLIR